MKPDKAVQLDQHKWCQSTFNSNISRKCALTPFNSAEVPDKRYLDLGKQLALDFVLQELPGHYEKIDSVFRRRGAYSRFKDLLCEHGALDAWYRFEESATQKALCTWAKEEGFEVQLEPNKTAQISQTRVI
ncbi:MAG: hypothetical protein WBN90_10490 [Gammaproteobacteria bacterium]